jgi:hypothetical protein
MAQKNIFSTGYHSHKKRIMEGTASRNQQKSWKFTRTSSFSFFTLGKVKVPLHVERDTG